MLSVGGVSRNMQLLCAHLGGRLGRKGNLVEACTPSSFHDGDDGLMFGTGVSADDDDRVFARFGALRHGRGYLFHTAS